MYDVNKPLPGKYIAVAIPMESLATESLHGIRVNYNYRGHIYENKFFTMYPNYNCHFIGNYMIFTQHLKPGKNWTIKQFISPETSLFKATTFRMFNHLRFHRRMAYPHAIHRSVKHGIFRGWIRCLPMILCSLSFCIAFYSSWLVLSSFPSKFIKRRAATVEPVLYYKICIFYGFYALFSECFEWTKVSAVALATRFY
ncbi:hypothetical protein GCK32_018547 [Trichostrongylus colubriformis]|uniref:Uncharacterized protein n=1 Tax=Trichostrongylus colubriformis TaxID=6319 RepID=A0AAN8FNN0_TRICO